MYLNLNKLYQISVSLLIGTKGNLIVVLNIVVAFLCGLPQASIGELDGYVVSSVHIFLKICFVISFYMTNPPPPTPLPNKKGKASHGVRNTKRERERERGLLADKRNGVS